MLALICDKVVGHDGREGKKHLATVLIGVSGGFANSWKFDINVLGRREL
jgi:hypothetical protein